MNYIVVIRYHKVNNTMLVESMTLVKIYNGEKVCYCDFDAALACHLKIALKSFHE